MSMNAARPPLTRLARPWLGAALGLSLAIGSALLLTELLMSPPSSELWNLAAYLAIAGAGTMVVGLLALMAADRALGLSIHAKTFLSSLVASGVGLVNVLIVAQFMFISTEHDLKLLIAIVAFSAVVATSLTLWVARTIATRLHSISLVVGLLAAGDLRAHADVAGGDEVARLAADVNTLARHLEAGEQQRQALDRERKELTTAISHDLRTPLASLRAMVEALDDKVIEGDEVQRYYGTMRREIDRLNRMIEDLFLLAQMDAGALRLNREQLSIEEILADVVDALQPQARQHEVSIRLRAHGPASAYVDGGRVERAIGNLIRNAIQHSPQGGLVDVTLETQNASVEVRVSDAGEGIDAADLPYIWQRFYRAEKSRQRGPRNADGAGLGLAIVRGIVEAHGGEVTAHSVARGGSTFAMRLPLQ